MVMIVRRWLPDMPITLVGDTAYSILELGLCCAKYNVTLIAPLRWDASLHMPPASLMPLLVSQAPLVGHA